jgi:hypothetical protein
MEFSGDSYEEIKVNVRGYLENPPMIILPGGSWCYFCNEEMCRNFKHSNRLLLQTIIAKLMRDLAEERKKHV